MDTAIRFNVDNRYYNLEFMLPELPIMFLYGDSSTGKSLLWKDFMRRRLLDKSLKNSLGINYFTGNDNLYNTIKNHMYNIVIIDNADMLVTPDIDEFIYYDLFSNSCTRWVLIGRKYYECTITSHCRGKLKQTITADNKINITVDYGPLLGGRFSII